MSFGAAKGMARQMAQFDQYDVLVVDLSDMPQIDFTATRALDDIIYNAQDSGRRVWLPSASTQNAEPSGNNPKIPNRAPA